MERIRILSGAVLKYIAFASMLIDHTNKALITPFLKGEGLLLYVSDVLDILGRIAFPLFAFMLVEGFFKTRSRTRHLLWLIGFGILSEIPFDMFSSGEFFDPRSNNVMFTLAIGFAAVWIMDIIRQKLIAKPSALWIMASLPVLAAACLAAMLTSVDWDYHAILVIWFFYLFSPYTLCAGHKQAGAILSVVGGYLSILKELWSALGFALTLMYNGKKGRQSKLANYLFYPVHLLIIGSVRLYLGI